MRTPPRTGSEMIGNVSLTIMLASSRVTRSRCPFERIGFILLAYLRCSLWRESSSEGIVESINGNLRATAN